LFGRWIPNGKGGYRFVPGTLVLAVIFGGIIYFDEVNFAPARINAVVHGLTDWRRTLVLLDAAGSGLCNRCGHINEVPPSGILVGMQCANCDHTFEEGDETHFKASSDTQVIAAINPGY
jgi:hypothetical protein